MDETYYLTLIYEIDEENRKSKLVALGIDPYNVDAYLGIDYYNNFP